MAKNVLYRELGCLGNGLVDDAEQWDTDVEVVSCANVNDVIDNSFRKRTIRFQCPEIGHIYFALKASSFCKLVCKWIDQVAHRCILHCRGFRKGVSAFQSSDPISVSNDGYEEYGPQVTQEVQDMFLLQVSRWFEINAKKENLEDSIELWWNTS